MMCRGRANEVIHPGPRLVTGGDRQDVIVVEIKYWQRTQTANAPLAGSIGRIAGLRIEVVTDPDCAIAESLVVVLVDAKALAHGHRNAGDQETESDLSIVEVTERASYVPVAAPIGEASADPFCQLG